MDDGTSALASAIGARVKQERQSRRWTLDQLAAAAGVSRRMLVNVEHGAANPSVGTLLRLSDALGVGLPALVDTEIRRSHGLLLWSGGRPAERRPVGRGRWGRRGIHRVLPPEERIGVWVESAADAGVLAGLVRGSWSGLAYAAFLRIR